MIKFLQQILHFFMLLEHYEPSYVHSTSHFLKIRIISRLKSFHAEGVLNLGIELQRISTYFTEQGKLRIVI